MCRCPIVVFINFSRCLLMKFSVILVQVFWKPFLIALKRLDVVGMKNEACIYCDSYSFVVWAMMLFSITSDCCVSRGNHHIKVCLFLVTFIICCPLFWTYIYCLFSMVVNPSPHKTTINIGGDVFIFGKI